VGPCYLFYWVEMIAEYNLRTSRVARESLQAVVLDSKALAQCSGLGLLSEVSRLRIFFRANHLLLFMLNMRYFQWSSIQT
jgi:hypothetical protein